MALKYDFSGWATVNDLKCSDGVTIRKGAFSECNGKKVPIVWNHQHNDPEEVLGHALLEEREKGMYAYCFLNDTERGQHAKSLVEHGDIDQLSIFANKLRKQNGNITHGIIREVSLVLAGANPGAFIDSVSIEHADGSADEDAIIFTGLEASLEEGEIELSHAASEEGGNDMAEESGEKTVQEVFDSMTDEQKEVCYALIGQAVEDALDEAGGNEEEGEEDMKHNVFDGEAPAQQEEVLTHAEMLEIIEDGKNCGSLRDAAIQHGITELGVIFDDYENLDNPPAWIKRETGWVTKVTGAAKHVPFSKIRSRFANITGDEARARGYITGNRKEEEVFTLLKRETEPQTIYKYQEMNRDDVIDINDFDVIAWIKNEMQFMWDEELARAILIGDGRSSASNDKIQETKIRPIWKDDSLFTINTVLEFTNSDTEDTKAKKFIRAAIKSRKNYKGSGTPTLFTTEDLLTDMLLLEDTTGRIIYDSVDKLKTALRVKDIVTVEVMENQTREVSGVTRTLLGLIVNMSDYTIGAAKGGKKTLFDDFDIRFNKEQYLLEARCCGALTVPYSAIAIESKASA